MAMTLDILSYNSIMEILQHPYKRNFSLCLIKKKEFKWQRRALQNK